MLVLHGPNLQRLGRREPSIYGHQTLAQLDASLVQEGERLGLAVTCAQSNHEGALIDALDAAADNGTRGIVFNPGALTHTSLALGDAIASIEVPVVEVHLSNLYSREAQRHVSLTAPRCVGVIMGLGSSSYLLALSALKRLLARA